MPDKACFVTAKASVGPLDEQSLMPSGLPRHLA